MLVILLPESSGDIALGPGVAGRLARLGVTSVALLRDEEGVGVVVLEGWAFDPAASEEALVAAIAADGPARSLHSVVQMALHPSDAGNGS